VVFAQLIVDGKSYGVKSFLVQLRDPVTFALRPGINIGDCGAKMVLPRASPPCCKRSTLTTVALAADRCRPRQGRHGIDNGFIQFTNVRIPRTNMLMKHTQVCAMRMHIIVPVALGAYNWQQPA